MQAQPSLLRIDWAFVVSGIEAVMTVADMTDLQLDARLTRLFHQHGAASSTQRDAWHLLIVDVLDEQKARRDVWLAEGAALVPTP